MARRMSRAQRRAAFLAEANKMFDAVEAWYDDHPDASFGEIEQEARARRRAFMGQQALTILVNGRDTGLQADPPRCAVCDAEMDFEDYRHWTVHGLEGDTTLEQPTTFAPTVSAGGFFPLDHKLKLRHDHRSDGAAEVATRMAMRESSFAWAAEEYRLAVGGPFPCTTTWRVATGAGMRLAGDKIAGLIYTGNNATITPEVTT